MVGVLDKNIIILPTFPMKKDEKLISFHALGFLKKFDIIGMSKIFDEGG